MREERNASESHPPTSEPASSSQPAKRFSHRKPIAIAVLLVVSFAVLIVLALRPRQQREQEVMEALQRAQDTPTVLVAKVEVAPARGDLLLPGSIQAITEAPIFARSEGYLGKRLVDIGDRVRAEQLLAVVETPEVDKQVLTRFPRPRE